MNLLRIFYHSAEKLEFNINNLEFHPEMIKILGELGIIEISGDCITPEQLQRIYKLMRLKNCLGANLSGAAIILDLLDRIEELQEEIERLKRTR
jgi:MerR family transcriptional regulator/heat shock protein HspR